jgi:DNA-binding transcriptional LysR family regulator
MQQEWKYIYTIWQEGSFSAAARKLFVTQPALSIAVRRIEEEYGEAIFDREAKPLRLTPAGSIVLRTIERTLMLEKEMTDQIRDLKNGETGQIRIGASPYISGCILPDILKGFAEKYPGIRIELFEDSSAKLLPMLEKQEIDITFSCNEDIIRRFPGRPGFSDRILIAVPSGYPFNELQRAAAMTADMICEGKHLARSAPKISLREFRDLSWIMLKNMHDRSEAMFAEAGYEPKISLQLSQLVSAYSLAQSGFAAAFVSDRVIRPHDQSLLFFLPDSEYSVREYSMILPQRGYISSACRLFMDYWLTC